MTIFRCEGPQSSEPQLLLYVQAESCWSAAQADRLGECLQKSTCQADTLNENWWKFKVGEGRQRSWKEIMQKHRPALPWPQHIWKYRTCTHSPIRSCTRGPPPATGNSGNLFHDQHKHLIIRDKEEKGQHKPLLSAHQSLCPAALPQKILQMSDVQFWLVLGAAHGTLSNKTPSGW